VSVSISPFGTVLAIVHEYHVHSNYSDSDFLFTIINAAEEAGLDGVGIADHCIVSNRASFAESHELFGFSLDRTHDRRRRSGNALD